ncbi:hypothetical protein TH63_18160 [Rufibacter radiotolerans]|uniref:DUF2939 domain-containing protein n=1 Tax=Rufibacter radiotolerans TaxID=1379910 RepID=A0A0H4VTJ8_9BACT|nr:DUF2939 domain-containing protein [Rufibacter radiotolerans]AKQ47129.1 hypothetical protein TH63_18160 [Rufibacter radiotolerans]
MKRIIVLVSVLVVIGAVGFWLYKRYAQGPEYSLYQIKQAVDNRDMAALEKYVDVDRTTASFLDQAVQAGMAELPQKQQAMAAIVLGMAMASKKEQVLQALRDGIEDYVEKGSSGRTAPKGVNEQEWEQLQSVLPLKKLLEENPLINSRLEGISYVNRQDSLAVVGLDLRMPSQPEPVIVEVQMVDKGTYWQVVGLPNAGPVMKQLGLLETMKQLQNLPQLKLKM